MTCRVCADLGYYDDCTGRHPCKCPEGTKYPAGSEPFPLAPRLMPNGGKLDFIIRARGYVMACREGYAPFLVKELEWGAMPAFPKAAQQLGGSKNEAR